MVAHPGKAPQEHIKGQMSVTQIDLRPDGRFDIRFDSDPAKFDEMQRRAHHYRFIASSMADGAAITGD